MTKKITTNSDKDMRDHASKFARELHGGEVLALTGELGAGKTTFAQGLAKGLGIKGRVTSPTFIIMRQYNTKLKTLASRRSGQNSKVKSLYHLDLYRLEHDLESEVKNLGITDVWGKPENIVVIEWAEKIKALLPRSATWIKFEVIDSGGHRVSYLE